MKPKTAMPLVIPLTDATRWGCHCVGGKAYHLGRLLEAGLPAPMGWCLTTAAFEAFLDAADPHRKLRSELDESLLKGGDALRTCIASLQQTFRATPLDHSLTASLRGALPLDDPVIRYAVRSSATTEDQALTSAAGQHTTVLNVRGLTAVLEAVRACWASLFDEHAVLYRQRLAQTPSEAAMAVVIQPFLPATNSGVAFTRHPITGQTDRIVIEACRGLGTTLVAGQIEPDRIVLDKASLCTIERHLGRKTLQARPDPRGGVRQEPVSEDQQRTPCLTPDQSRELGELARQAEQRLGIALDLEWALHAGRIKLLQARPITSVSQPKPNDSKPPGARPEIWTQANAIETFPDVVTPLSWSILERIIQLCLGPIVERLGTVPFQRQFVARIAGRAYLNLSVFEELLAEVPPAYRFDLTTALGGHDPHPEAGPSSHSPFPGWLPALRRNAPLLFWILSAFPSQSRIIAEWIGRLDDPRTRQDPAEFDDATLARLPGEVLRIACRGSGGRTGAAGVWMAATAAAGSTLLFQFTRRWLNDTLGIIANRLLSGSPGMTSTQPAIDLWNLSVWTREHPELRAVVDQSPDFSTLSARLPALLKGPEFLARWRALLDLHGHQARSGMDISSPRWDEMPDYVLGQLRSFLAMDPESGPLRTQARLAQERRDLQQHIRARLRNPLKRAWLRTLARTSQRGMAQRENVKQAGVRMIALLRKVVMEIGRRLADRQVLCHPDDVFFLELDELESALLGHPAADLKSEVSVRKDAHHHHLRVSPPTVIVGPPTFDSNASHPPPPATTRFQGLGVSPGVAIGKARVILHADHEEHVCPGEILVAPFTDPGWAAYFIPAAGLVVDLGGLLSHGSIVAREYGLPAVVNVGPATRVIRTGQTLRVDGNQGTVEVLDDANGAPGKDLRPEG